MLDWKKEIGIAFLVKQKLFDVDVDELWPLHHPEAAATAEELDEADEVQLDQTFTGRVTPTKIDRGITGASIGEWQKALELP